MKIYGKTLGAIFREVPLPYKFVIVCGTVYIAYSIGYAAYAFSGLFDDANRAAPVTLPESDSGVLDPSVASDGKTAVLAYGALSAAAQTSGGIDVRITTSASGCEKWRRDGQPLFDMKPDDLLAPDGVSTLAKGIWRAETPSIVYDPADPQRPWKAFAYRYFWSDNVKVARRYGMIAYRYAASPQGPWSTEEWALGASQDHPAAPYSGLVHQQINAMHPSLKNVEFYARPSVISAKGILFMTLSAFTAGEGGADRIVLLASTDKAKTWRYLGTALSRKNLPAGNFTRIGGASLVMQDGNAYLSVVFGDDKVAGLGAHLIPFADLPRAQLAADKDGRPLIRAVITRQSAEPVAAGGGFLAYHDACKNRSFLSEFSGVRNTFQIFDVPQKPVQ